MAFKTNGKKDFWICSIVSTAMIFEFYAVFLFVTLFCHGIQQNWIQNMTLPMHGTVFAVFALIHTQKKNNCAMTNKMDRN